jgi:hypothetical protein
VSCGFQKQPCSYFSAHFHVRASFLRALFNSSSSRASFARLRRISKTLEGNPGRRQEARVGEVVTSAILARSDAVGFSSTSIFGVDGTETVSDYERRWCCESPSRASLCWISTAVGVPAACVRSIWQAVLKGETSFVRTLHFCSVKSVLKRKSGQQNEEQ